VQCPRPEGLDGRLVASGLDRCGGCSRVGQPVGQGAVCSVPRGWTVSSCTSTKAGSAVAGANHPQSAARRGSPQNHGSRQRAVCAAAAGTEAAWSGWCREALGQSPGKPLELRSAALCSDGTQRHAHSMLPARARLPSCRHTRIRLGLDDRPFNAARMDDIESPINK